MATAEPFGPFRSDCDQVERVAQFRVLRALAHVFTPPAFGNDFEKACSYCERNPSLPTGAALHYLDTMPTLVRRRILATFAALHSPVYNSGCKGLSLEATHDDRQIDRPG